MEFSEFLHLFLKSSFLQVNKDKFEDIDDKELLQNYYNSGDNSWLGLLLQRYTLLLLGVCMKYLRNEEEAKDAVQQVFLKVIRDLKKYKVDYFKSWLYIVARNHCLMKLRDKPGEFRALTENIDPTEDELGKTDQLEKDRLISFIESSLDNLGNEQKTCVILFYFQKKSYQEISTATGYSLHQVKSYIQNGKRNLKLLVEKKMKEQS